MISSARSCSCGAGSEGEADGRELRSERAGQKQEARRDFDHSEHVARALDAEELVPPGHERTVRDERRDALRLVGGELHAAEPEKDDGESVRQSPGSISRHVISRCSTSNVREWPDAFAMG